MSTMAVAKRGDSMYMCDVRGENGTAEQTCTVVDVSTGRRWGGLRVQSVLARGYWEPFDGPVPDMKGPPGAAAEGPSPETAQ